MIQVMSPRNYIKTLVANDVDKAEVLSPKQFTNLLTIAGAGRNGLRNTSIIWHSFGSALRVTEIALLKIQDVLKTNGDIRDLGRLPASYTKNGKSRIFIQVESDQKEAIKKYIDYRIENKLRLSDKSEFRGLQPDSPFYLARGASGFALGAKTYSKADGSIAESKVCSSMQQLITSLLKGVGVRGGSSHSGRRTFATRLDARGVDETLIQMLLGHGEINQTMNYIDPRIEEIKKALGRIYPGL